MNASDIETSVIAALQDIAPEIDDNELVRDQSLRSQVDLDSMDWLNFLVRLHSRLGVDIPESDYAALVTLANITDYVSTRIPS